MRIPRPIGHLAYRVAGLGLRIVSLIVHPHTRGTKVLVCAGDEILLVRHSYGPRQWDLPGGFVRRNEPFEDAARRELSEELGIAEDAGAYTDLGGIERHYAGREESIRLFRVDLAEPSGEIQGFELCRIGWFTREDLPARQSPLIEEILQRDLRFA